MRVNQPLVSLPCMWQGYRAALLLMVGLLLHGCASMATHRLAASISSAMLNQDDPATVKAGAPAYLLLLDGLIRGAPDDRALLLAGARLNHAFGLGLVQDPTRTRRLTSRAREYARRALCRGSPMICAAERASFDGFTATLAKIRSAELEALYVYGVSWAGWIQARVGNWNALADLPRVEAVFERVIDLEPGHDHGRAQLYLGVMRSQLPRAMGGRPEIGREHFERALRYSEGRDLMAKVEYARHYARLVFDQSLHDRLLNEVLAADPVVPDLTLSNVLAQQQARLLLAEDYF